MLVLSLYFILSLILCLFSSVGCFGNSLKSVFVIVAQPSHGHILCRGDKRRLTHIQRRQLPSPENFLICPLRCNYMNAKVALVGFTTRPVCCVSQGSNILSQTPNVDTVVWENKHSDCSSPFFPLLELKVSSPIVGI